MSGSTGPIRLKTGRSLPIGLILLLGFGCDPIASNQETGSFAKPNSSTPECDDCPSAKVLSIPELGPGELLNPQFLSWQIYPEGTTTVRLDHQGSGLVVREVTSLLQKTDRVITLLVTMTRLEKDKVTLASEQVISLPLVLSQRGYSTERNSDAIPKTVEVVGKLFPSFLSESNGSDANGSYISRRWDSDTVPGLLIRLERESPRGTAGPARKTVKELVELKMPNWAGN